MRVSKIVITVIIKEAIGNVSICNRKSVYNFTKKIVRSTNAIIFSCVSASIYLYSPIRKWWNSHLYLF